MVKILSKNLCNMINQFKGFEVGLHCVNTTKEQEEIAKEKISTNLQIGNNIRENVNFAGVIGKNDLKIANSIQNYEIGKVNILLLCPPYIENSKGEKLYFQYNEDTQFIANFNLIFNKLGYIPKEFIFGYYVGKELCVGKDITYEFTRNYAFGGTKVSDELFLLISNTLLHIQKEYISNVPKRNFEKLKLAPWWMDTDEDYPFRLDEYTPWDLKTDDEVHEKLSQEIREKEQYSKKHIFMKLPWNK